MRALSRLIIVSISLGLGLSSATARGDDSSTIILAGGCFWCVESDFDQVEGVLETISGYTAGNSENPTYSDHTAAGHYEAVKITFDSAEVGYRELLDIFWRTIDVTDSRGQFCDRGPSYRTAVFVEDDEQRATAEASKAMAEEALGDTIVTPILDAEPFWPAEDYHQDFYVKNPLRYKAYRYSCGRNQRVEQVWGEAAYRGIDGH